MLNLNVIPIVGWLTSAFAAVCIAVPFWFVWTICGVGEDYFYFLPQVYHRIGFWACVGLSIVFSILKSTLVPKLVWVSNSCEKKND